MFSFLKYYDGAVPNKLVKRKLIEDKSENNKQRWKEYETKRGDRQFQDSWKQNRPWLCFEDGVMTCSYCKNAPSTVYGNLKGNNAFIKGSRNFKLSTIQDHESCSGHVKAEQKSKAANSSPSETLKSVSGKTLMSLKIADRYRLVHLFRNAHAVGKHGRPLRDYIWLNKCTAAHGTDIGSTYLNEKSALLFLKYISGAEQDKTKASIKNAKFFSILMDGSTDLSGDEQESIYVRYSDKGKVTERFVSIGSPNSTCSKDLKSHVDSFLSTNSFEKEKCVGLGSDGASNMVGNKSGLATLLREDIGAHFINIHCFNHRLELAFRDVVKNNKFYDKLMTLLIGLYYFYHKQYKNKKGLMNAFEALSMPSIVPPKVTGTRWVPHLSNAIRSLLKGYKAYECHLSTISHSNAKAEGLVKLLLSKQIVAFVLFIQDLLDPLEKLSKKLQRKHITLSEAYIWTECTQEIISEKETQELNKTLIEVIDSGVFQGIKLKGVKPSISYRSHMISGICTAISSRFKLDEKEMSVVSATKVINIQCWPIHSVESLREFGNREIEVIADYYNKYLSERFNTFSPATALQEWKMLKKVLHKRHGNGLLTMTWEELYSTEEDFATIYVIIDLIQSLPPTSVSCETSFSQLKLIKTSRRLRLKESTLNSLMTAKIVTPDVVDFDPNPAIDKWMADAIKPHGKRRPSYHRQNRRSEETSITGISVTEEDNTSDIDNTCDLKNADLYSTDYSDDDEDAENLYDSDCSDPDSDYFSDFQDETENTEKLKKYLEEE